MSDLEDGVKAVGAVVIVLVIIDKGFSQEAWVFAVTALIAWSVADFVYEKLKTEASTEPVEFAVYSVIIIVASALGALTVEYLMPTLLVSSQSPNASKLDLLTVIFYSALAGTVAYLLPNLPVLLAAEDRFHSFHNASIKGNDAINSIKAMT